VTLAGHPARLDRAIEGRPAVLSLWATWCQGCLEELAALQRLARGLRPRGGVVVTVAVGEDPAAVEHFVRGRGLPFVQLVDQRFRLADALGQRRVPATLVVDRSSRVVFRGGPLDAAALHAVRDVLGRD